MRFERDFVFTLHPRRRGIDIYDTRISTRVIQTEERVTVIFRTGEMQFSTSYKSYNYKRRMFNKFAKEIHEIVQAFCMEHRNDIMINDDIACTNAAQYGLIGICNPKNIETLKKFHQQLTSMFSIRMECDFGLEPLKSRIPKDRENDYIYTTLDI